MREAPQTLFTNLFKAWKITHLVFEKDTDAYARDWGKDAIKAAKEAGVEVIVRAGCAIWNSDDLVAKNHDKPTMSITQGEAAGPKISSIPRSIPAPKSIPNPVEAVLESGQQQPNLSPDFDRGSRNHGGKTYEKILGPNSDFAVPTMDELGFPAATTPLSRGEP
jgi:cryptochrome